ncbi:6,7-dimethyl-8-ribityllumazine synthase [Roseomonas rosulenta]|uniref:6,7-dimethyl-8-ribityllumazine synthase n=1 Tax=Roseomonas rosulenta TaxID=2748667 RepID=UPI0018E03B30|nr:6,7-dimethyl-8-ribityllumazine synthase [Roseomonas rosulenta]
MSTLDSPERGAATLAGPSPRILVIAAPYYRDVVDGMRHGAERVLADVAATSEAVEVAGAYELPAALAMALASPRRWDGFLLLGCVVRGETDHYTFICDAICHGVMDLSTKHAAAIGFGLLTVDTLAQAEARSRDDRMNKGAEAAHAVLGQIALARGWGLAG